MAATLLHPAEQLTPTGLDPDDLAGLTSDEKHALAGWMRGKAGDDDGRPWWPWAIRRMPLAQRLTLALDKEADAHWCERERRRVEHDPVYFTVMYGSVQPEEGSPVPFLLWDHEPDGAIGAKSQLDAVRQLRRHLRIIFLKARQLGLTWAALHDAVHVLAFDRATPNARVLALSKHGGDATKLLERTRKIISRLPPFLRPAESNKTKDSKTELELVGRGKMVSLAGTPEAARMETATLVILDEFGHVRHRGAEPTWTAVVPTMGRRGRAIIIFTGNGPPEAPGDGQAAATLWQKARSGEDDVALEGAPGAGPLYPIFLPSSTDPTRDDAFHADKRGAFINPEDYQAEYPETEDEALAGRSTGKVYSPAGINAAQALGAEYDRLLDAGRMPPPAGDVVSIDCDWGEMTHLLLLWPLEGGGFYVAGEVEMDGGEVGEATKAMFDGPVARAQRELKNGALYPLVGGANYDAAGVQSNRTMKATIETSPELLKRCKAVRQKRANGRGGSRIVMTIPTTGVPFGQNVAGAGSLKDLGKDYLRHLFGRARAGERVRIIAISPRAVVLLRQLRGLEKKDDGTGRIKKGDDHGPDALIAGVARAALRHRDRLAAGEEKAA